jgi:PAS domain S-box-containing protein
MRLDSSRRLGYPSRLPHSPLVVAAVLLLLLHIAVLAVFRHSPSLSLFSDCFMLASALFTSVACMLASRRSKGIARSFWVLTGLTFALWFLGKSVLFYDSNFLGIEIVRIVPLLLFFFCAAPMFVAVFLSDDDFRDTINWEWILDAVQILGLVIIIYLIVIFIPLRLYGEPAVSATEDRLLLWRNILLAMGLLARALFSGPRYIRRLYFPVGFAMGVFAVTTWIANHEQEVLETPDAAKYDLAWTIPFCIVALAAVLWRDVPDSKHGKLQISDLTRVTFTYLPSLVLPVMLLMKYYEVVRTQVFLGIGGLMLSIVLFNVRLVLTLRRQRRTTEALRAAESQYHSLFEKNMAGVFRSTLEGKLLDCNPAFANMLGYTREELCGIPMSKLYFGGAEERNQWILNLRNEEQPLPCEILQRRRDGSPLWAVQNANLEKQPDGSELLEGTVVDITEQKLTNLAVEDWKRRYDEAVLASRQIIYEWALDSEQITLGGCVREILDYSSEEISGPARVWLSLLHEDDAAHVEESFRAALMERQPVDLEYRARRKDGSYRTLRQQGRTVLDETGNAIRLVGFISDITEQRILETQLAQAQKMEAVGRLAGGVAHDFNNLLTVISGYSAMQLERTDQANPVHYEATQIMAAANRASALTKQLLAFSRQQVLQPRRVNLNDIVGSVDPMLRRLIGEDIEVQTALAPGLGTVKVDPGQMDQVLMNLVVNSRDAMPNGGKLTIQTENVELAGEYVRDHTYVRSGRYVLLAVSDNGAGMDPETQARMFEPFFTTKEPGKGTGLGMPMVYGIVKQSGGYIEVYSERNRGTAIKIYLPRVDAPVEEIKSNIEQSQAIGGAEKILLIEDDAQLRELITEILTGRGYHVEVIGKIDELEKMVQNSQQCDLLLTDVVMPKMSGPEVAALVARHWPEIKVLFMSGYTADAIVHHGILNQGLFFLQKPFTPSGLAAKVREILNAPSKPEVQR